MSEEEEIRGFQIGGLRAEVFNADTSVFENTAMPIHIADCRFGCRHSVESRHEIVRHSRLPYATGISLSCLKEDHLEMRHFDWHTDCKANLTNSCSAGSCPIAPAMAREIRTV